jgi:hypothetical protein
MNATSAAVYTDLNPKAASQAFRVVVNILNQWGCSLEQKEALLGMKRASYYNYLKHSEQKKPINLNRDQIDRLSYLLNIYQALKIVFSNKENVDGFVNMPNDNPFFNGKTPLQVMETGHLAHLYEVYRRVDALRGGQW